MSAPVKKSVELFYDCISPYSWIAFEVLCRYQTRWNIDLKLKPFFLGGVMAASGNQPPAMVAAKGAYMHQDLMRLRTHFQVPLSPVSDVMVKLMQKGSLSAMRFITALDMKFPEKTEAVTREMWMRMWSRDQNIFEPQDFMEVGNNCGLSEAVTEEAIKMIKDPAVKDRLKQYTQEAIDYGAFGAPTIIVEDDQKEKHMVFGSDRFHIIADILKEEYVGPLKDLAKTKL